MNFMGKSTYQMAIRPTASEGWSMIQTVDRASAAIKHIVSGATLAPTVVK